MLPHGIVGELNGQFGQRAWFTAGKSIIEGSQLVGHQPDGPTVRHSVVHCYLEDMLLTPQAQQVRPEKRRSLQVKHPFSLRTAQSFDLGFSLRIRELADIRYRNLDLHRRLDHLHQLTPVILKAGPEDFVPPEDFIDGAPHQCRVERTGQLKSYSHIEGRNPRGQLI